MCISKFMGVQIKGADTTETDVTDSESEFPISLLIWGNRFFLKSLFVICNLCGFVPFRMIWMVRMNWNFMDFVCPLGVTLVFRILAIYDRIRMKSQFLHSTYGYFINKMGAVPGLRPMLLSNLILNLFPFELWHNKICEWEVYGVECGV